MGQVGVLRKGKECFNRDKRAKHGHVNSTASSGNSKESTGCLLGQEDVVKRVAGPYSDGPWLGCEKHWAWS